MRWSPWLSSSPGCRRPPRTTRWSSPDSTPTPSRVSSSPTVAMRSLSLTRSSAASRNSVTPSANAAATASTGISSITQGSPRPRRWCRAAARSHPQLTHRLAELLAGVDDLDRRAHAHEHVDERDARRVERDVLDHELGAGRDRRGHDPERGRRRIARHVELERRRRAGGDAHRPLVDPGDRRAERGEHALGVVAARRRARRPRWCRRPAARRAAAPSSPARSPPRGGARTR